MPPAAEYSSVYGSPDDGRVQEECWACFAVSILFWLFLSLTMTMGYYGAKKMELGPNYSSLVKANSFFVSNIQVNGDDKIVGPVLYSFPKKPLLGPRSIWQKDQTVLLKPNYHQELPMWLNRGSKLQVTCFVKSIGFYSILLTVSEGYNGLKQWVQNPTNPSAATVWKEISGPVGHLEYEVKRDGEYFVAVGNLNKDLVALGIQVQVNATIYDTEHAETQCLVTKKSCEVKLAIFGERYAVLSTPPEENVTVNWVVDVSYGARWTFYYGVLGFLLLVLSIFFKATSRYPELVLSQDEHVQSPFLSIKGDTSILSLDDPDDIDNGIENANGEGREEQQCVICLDAARAVFFIPCGHCATCLKCAKRISHNADANCPICRARIDKIRRLFHV